MATRISSSPEQTRAFGRELGETVPAGTLIGLVGDLGAGKTLFVKGFAEGLGVADKVHSPTFSLVNEYTGGRLPCHHLDLYRLDSPAQVRGAGLEEFLEPRDGVVLVEWYDRVAEFDARPIPGSWVIRFETLGEGERALHYESFGG